MEREVHLFSDGDALSRFAEARIRQSIAEALAGSGRCGMVLAGGATPRALYARLARPVAPAEIDWERVDLFWGDERCVAPGDPQSNYAMAHMSLIGNVPIPSGNVLRMRGELGAAAGARAYESALRLYFSDPQKLTARGYPAFDLVLLGMGTDGHIASLFPHAAVLDEQQRWTSAAHAPRGISPAERITLTLPVLSSADTVMFLVSGKGKTQLAEDIADGRCQPTGRFPASLVLARRRLVWCIAQ